MSIIEGLNGLIAFSGSYGRLEHWRNGEKLATLFDEDVYDYDTPVNNV